MLKNFLHDSQKIVAMRDWLSLDAEKLQGGFVMITTKKSLDFVKKIFAWQLQ